MTRTQVLTGLFILFSVFCFYLFYRLVIPFFVPIAWTTVLAVMFHPMYRWFNRRLNRPNLSSLIVTLIVLLVILFPVAYLGVSLVSQAQSVIQTVGKAGTWEEYLSYDPIWFVQLKAKLEPYMDVSNFTLSGVVKDMVTWAGGFLAGHSGWLVANITRTIFYFLIIMFSLFYFLRDGNLWLAKLRRVIPLNSTQLSVAFAKVRDIIEVTMIGGVAIALIQGLLGGVLFASVGIPDAIFWGAIMTFMSLVPFVGSFIVYVPAGLILIATGATIKGLIVIILGVVVVSQVDNVLRPFMLAGRTQMHPLLLFFTIMGGVALFGLLGIVIGPLVAAVFIALLNIFEMRIGSQDRMIEEGI